MSMYARGKDLALSREDYRCMITGTFDYPSIRKFPAVQQNYKDVFHAETASGNTQIAIPLQAAHIIPQSIHAGLSAERLWADSISAVLSRFECDGILNELDGDNIHRPENIMMLRSDWHGLFDNLWIWLEEIPGSPNTYQVVNSFAVPFPKEALKIVTVTNHASANVDIPLPSRKYLALHAACARVADLSGANDYVDEILKHEEKLVVLSEDGSSADTLRYALSQISVR